MSGRVIELIKIVTDRDKLTTCNANQGQCYSVPNITLTFNTP